jgi:hypothetical protein
MQNKLHVSAKTSHHQADYKNKTEKFTVSWFDISKLTSTLYCYIKIYNTDM